MSADALIHLKCFGLTLSPVESQHELGGCLFAGWVFDDQLFKMCDELWMASKLQFGVRTSLEGT
jgi:hypothetical protein